jgi:hypothetical protein
MKYRLMCLSTVLVFLCTLAEGEEAYVKTSKEALHASPGGEKTGELMQKAAVERMGEKGEWVQVTVTGWVKKGSLTADLSTIKAAATDKKDAGEGFFFSNTSIKKGPLGTQCIGEMANESDKDWTLANFVVSVYDADGALLETAYINMSNFKKDAKKSFQAFLVNSTVDQIASYKIQFENGM